MSPKIIRSRRRTLALEVKEDACVVVRAPYFVSNTEIERFVRDRENWIKKNKRRILYERRREKKFVEGEKFLYLGVPYELRTGNYTEPLLFNDSFMLSEIHREDARKYFISWYKNQAQKYIPERVVYHAKLYNLKYNRVSITRAEKQWGSCSGKNLNFSWRLIMAPVEVIDYVVMHELAHILHKNHSIDFWDMVERMCPKYQKYDRWLKRNEYRCTI